MSAGDAKGSTRSQRARSPFPGVAAFRQEDARLFSGRLARAREVRERWLSERVVVLSGSASVGKTSLLRAGVLPGIGAKDADMLPVGRITSARGPKSPRRTAASFTAELLQSWKGDGRPLLRNMTVLEFMKERRAPASGGSANLLPTLACIDQIEDLYAEPAGIVAGEQFLDEISIAVEALPAVHLLLLVRQDALRALAEHKRFAELRPSYVKLRPFNLTEALDAIVNPARVSQMSFASGIAERLVKDLQTVTFSDMVGNTATIYCDQIEPLHVQIACRDLWETLPAGTSVISGERLAAWGGVDRAMTGFYEAAVSEVAAGYGVTEGRLRDWVRRTFVTELGTRDSVQSSGLALAEMSADVVRALADSRILTAEHRDSAVWYQLSHDRLAYAVVTADRAYHQSRGAQAVQPGGEPTAASLQAAAETALRDRDLPAAERSIAEAADKFRAAGNWRRLAAALVLHADIARAQDAQDAQEQEHLTGAERLLREALSIYFMLEDRYAAARVLSAIAELHFITGDYEEAAELHRHAVERMPGDVTALTGLAYAQWQSGSPADAEATFGQVLRWDSGTALALAGRGQVRAELGEYDCALEDLERALQLRLSPEAEADARSARALALAGLGRPQEAEAELETAFQLDPDRPRSRLRAGRIAAILGHPNEVRAEIERALNGRPTLSGLEQEFARRLLRTLR